jgi:hypothetical protein
MIKTIPEKFGRSTIFKVCFRLSISCFDLLKFNLPSHTPENEDFAISFQDLHIQEFIHSNFKKDEEVKNEIVHTIEMILFSILN